MQDEQNQKLIVPTWRKIVGGVSLTFGFLFGIGALGLIVYMWESGWFVYQTLYYQFDFFVAFALLSPFLLLLGLFLFSRMATGRRYQAWLFAARQTYFFISAFLFLYGAVELMCFGTLGPKIREAPGGWDEYYGYGDFSAFFVLALILGIACCFIKKLNLKDVQQVSDVLLHQRQLQRKGAKEPSSFDPQITPRFISMQPQQQSLTIRPKSRLAYVLLAFPFFGLGLFGIHNFYALRIKSAAAQFLIAFLSLGALTPINLIWSVFEICLVNRDGRGVPLQ